MLQRLRMELYQKRGLQHLKPIVMIQGGGARGSWQSGVLSRLRTGQAIRPVACFGTSIGAINAFLFCASFNPATNRPNSLLRDFWRNLLANRWTYIRSIFSRIRILETLKETLLGRARQGLTDFEAFRSIFQDLLGHLRTEIYVYIYAADIKAANPDHSNVLYPTFWICPGRTQAEVHYNNYSHGECDIVSALAASACLPPIRGFQHRTLLFKDGGLITNLPVDTAITQGTYGGNMVLVMLSKKLSEFRPNDDPIDFKTLATLRQLQELQNSDLDKSRREGSGIFAAVTHYPVVIVEPKQRLRAGLWEGFVFGNRIKEDYVAGLHHGRHLKAALKELAEGNVHPIRPWLLNNVKLPTLPGSPPKFKEWWLPFVSDQWA